MSKTDLKVLIRFFVLPVGNHEETGVALHPGEAEPSVHIQHLLLAPEPQNKQQVKNKRRDDSQRVHRLWGSVEACTFVVTKELRTDK